MLHRICAYTSAFFTDGTVFLQLEYKCVLIILKLLVPDGH